MSISQLSTFSILTEVSITHYHSASNGKVFLAGRIKEAIVQGESKNLAYVLFHVVNFHCYLGKPPSILKQGENHKTIERIALEAGEWKITLDQLKTTKDNINSLKSQGGFAITHVGKLEKLDKQTFTGKEARDILVKFADFLSFTRGFSVPVILLSGYDAKENKMWEHWEQSAGNSWKCVSSWCPTQDAHLLAEVFPGFLNWWQNWEESERLALYWYLEANYSSLPEQTIILAQIALELLAWVVLVEKEKTLTSCKFKKLPASEKIRRLLLQIGIPLTLPPNTSSSSGSTLVSSFTPKQDLTHSLVNLAEKNHWCDGPHALTEIRNGVMHPEKTKRQNIYQAPFESKLDASELGLWYLELVMLAMYDYQGCYTNRLLRNGETETVPWS